MARHPTTSEDHHSEPQVTRSFTPNPQADDPKVHPELRPENQPHDEANQTHPIPVAAVGDPSTLSGAPNTPPTHAQVVEDKARAEREANPDDPNNPPQGATPEPIPLAHATRAASVAHPSAPEPPTNALHDHSEKAVKEREKQHAGMDARLVLANDLARRGLAYASINDLAKAVLLMLDMHHTPTAGQSEISKAADKGDVPTLL